MIAFAFGFAVAAGLLTGFAKLAFWVPLAAFVALLLVGMAMERRAQR